MANIEKKGICMRFTIKREEFLKGLNIASRAISSKNAKAVLENFKLV